MSVDLIKRIVCEIITTHLDEISCEECFNRVGRLAELTLSGQDASATMPLVRDHLELCADCREEFEALLNALGAAPHLPDTPTTTGSPPQAQHGSARSGI